MFVNRFHIPPEPRKTYPRCELIPRGCATSYRLSSELLPARQALLATAASGLLQSICVRSPGAGAFLLLTSPLL